MESKVLKEMRDAVAGWVQMMYARASLEVVLTTGEKSRI